MPNQPLINALMGGQLGQQQPFGSNIFGTNNQQWGTGGTDMMGGQQGQQPQFNASPWSGTENSAENNSSGALQAFHFLMRNMGQGGMSAFFGGQPRMQPPTGMPQGWGQSMPWGQQGGQG